MFESIARFFRRIGKKEQEEISSKETAKERLHLVLMQDRANVSADFLDMMKQEIIEVIKKYIDIDEKEIDVKLTNKVNEDGTTGAPALYANIPITNIKQDVNVNKKDSDKKDEALEEKIEAPEVEEKENEKSSEIEKESENKEEIEEEIIEEAQEIIDSSMEEDKKEEDVPEEEQETVENNEEPQEIEAEEIQEEIVEDEVEEEESKTTKS